MTKDRKKVAFKTLGCRLNQYETDALVTNFDQAGYQLVNLDESPDVVVVNTCTVTNQSDQKSRSMISQAARKNNEAVVVVTGCMANNFREKLESQGAHYLCRRKQPEKFDPVTGRCPLFG